LDVESRVRLMQDAVSAGVLQMDLFGEEVRCGVGRVGEINGQTGQIIAEVAALGERFGSVNRGMHNQSAGAQVARQGRHDGGGHPGGPSGPA
jgi:methyl-accepting chemotaxis protein WspA